MAMAHRTWRYHQTIDQNRSFLRSTKTMSEFANRTRSSMAHKTSLGPQPERQYPAELTPSSQAGERPSKRLLPFIFSFDAIDSQQLQKAGRPRLRIAGY